MHVRTMGTLAALAATLVLAFAVTTASANNISTSNRNFRIVWSEMKFFDEGEASERLSTLCPVTMEGSFHSATIRKVARQLIGYISRAVVNEAACREGLNAAPARFLPESLPWHVTYAAFSGTLPNITRMRVLVSGIRYESTLGMRRCLFAGADLGAEFLREAGGRITGFEFDHSTTLPALAGSGTVCEIFRIRGGLERLGTVTLLGNTTAITLRLI
jgi:hypothetical protein